MYIKGNVTKDEDLKNAMSIIKEKYGRLDFAINNAGITGVLHNFLDQSESQFDKIMAVNVKGVFLSMQNEITLMMGK